MVYSGIPKPRGCFSFKQHRDDSTEDQSHGSGISQTFSSPSPAEEMQVLERIFMERYSRINPSQGLGNCRGPSLLCEEPLKHPSRMCGLG